MTLSGHIINHESSVVIALSSLNFMSSSIFMLIYIFILFICLFIHSLIFETRFLCVAMAVMELALYTMLCLISEIQLPLLPSAEIKGFLHHCQAGSVSLNYHLWPTAAAVLFGLIMDEDHGRCTRSFFLCVACIG